MRILETIAASAGKANLEFLLAGGHAVIVHGHPRSTFDLDLIVPREDRSKWLALAAALGYRIFHEGPAFVQFTPQDQGILPLDLMLVERATFDKLMTEAVLAPASSGTKVVSLRHLLALKCHAIKHGHAGRVEKDVDDVLHLIKSNGIDLCKAEMRDLFLKYGPKELYEKLQRTCRPE